MEAVERRSSSSFNFIMLLQMGLITWTLVFTGSGPASGFGAAFALSNTSTELRVITYVYFASNVVVLSYLIFLWLHYPLVTRRDVRYVLSLYTLSLIDIVGA